MPLDPHARRLLAMLAAAGAGDAAGGTIGERRHAFAALMRLSESAVEVGSVEDRFIQGPCGSIGLRFYTPIGAGRDRLAGLVYFHGGGLVAGDLSTHDSLCRSLANASGCRVIAVDYRLAPEHKFPAAAVDCYHAAIWVLGQATTLGIDPERLAVGGDSAGGALAAVVCQMARETRGARFALQLLLCPILDFTAATASRRTLGKGYLLEQATMARDIAQYVPPGIDLAHPRVSPLRALELEGLPPAFIHTSEFDPLRDEGCAYANRLKQAGVAVSYTCHAGMIHLFYGLSCVIPYARIALKAIGAELAAALARSDARFGNRTGRQTWPAPSSRDPKVDVDLVP
jgi:acetyl esterase